MKVVSVSFCRFSALALLMMIVAGCTTAKRAPLAETPPTSPSAAAPAVPNGPHGGGVTPPQPTGGLPAGEYTLRVDSEPGGAVVVVNGIPIGKTPQRVILPGTPRGFCREQVSLKVRFIAADAGQSSQTVEELLTPLDKIPAAVNFTPNGASRVAR